MLTAEQKMLITDEPEQRLTAEAKASLDACVDAQKSERQALREQLIQNQARLAQLDAEYDLLAERYMRLRVRALPSSEVMTLGTLIAWLETMAPDAPIRDLGSADSYRGSYEHIAFEPVTSSTSARELLARVRDCVGETYGGWKGGLFTMSEHSAVYLAESGQSSAPHLTPAYFSEKL